MHSPRSAFFDKFDKKTYIYFVISEKSTTFAPTLNIFSFYFEHFCKTD